MSELILTPLLNKSSFRDNRSYGNEFGLQDNDLKGKKKPHFHLKGCSSTRKANWKRPIRFFIEQPHFISTYKTSQGLLL